MLHVHAALAYVGTLFAVRCTKHILYMYEVFAFTVYYSLQLMWKMVRMRPKLAKLFLEIAEAVEWGQTKGQQPVEPMPPFVADPTAKKNVIRQKKRL